MLLLHLGTLFVLVEVHFVHKIVLLETDVPGYGGAGSDRAELVDNLAWQIVDTVLVQLSIVFQKSTNLELGVADPVSSELVQFRFLHPLNAL